MTDDLFYTTHESTIGNLVLVASARGLRYVSLLAEGENAAQHLASNPSRFSAAASLTELKGFFTSTLAALDAYLKQGTPLKLPVDLVGGTPLQRIVWLEIAKIPYGETISYTTLADRVGFPRAIRAVASACGANPVPLAIACHRILSKDGSLGGFSLGGTDVKEFLLLTESQKQQAVA